MPVVINSTQIIFGLGNLIRSRNFTIFHDESRRITKTRFLFIFFLYFIYLFHLRSYLQYSLTDTYTHNTQWTSSQIKRILSFTVITTHYYIRVALVCNVLVPFLKMDGQLITRFGNHHFELVNHLNPSV